MGKILVIYHSATGNTARMAQYVAEGAEQTDMTVRLRAVEEATAKDVLWADGIAAGAPTNLGVLSWQMKRFWDEISPEIWGHVDGKIACAFSSSGGWGGGNELTLLSLLIVLMNFGFLTFGVPDYVGKRFTLHYGPVVAQEPRADKEIAACRRLGQRLAHWVAAYRDQRNVTLPPARER